MMYRGHSSYMGWCLSKLVYQVMLCFLSWLIIYCIFFTLYLLSADELCPLLDLIFGSTAHPVLLLSWNMKSYLAVHRPVISSRRQGRMFPLSCSMELDFFIWRRESLRFAYTAHSNIINYHWYLSLPFLIALSDG